MNRRKMLLEWHANPDNQKALEEIISSPVFKLAEQVLSSSNIPKGITEGSTGHDTITAGALKLAWLGGFHDFTGQLQMLTEPLPKPDGGIPEAWEDKDYVAWWTKHQQQNSQ
jgi:hypothetical protein